MPQTYRIKLSDGREFDVTTEGGPPSEQDVLGSLGAPPPISSQLETPAEPAAAPSWSDRMGLNEGTASAPMGFAKGAASSAVDMAQGAAATLMRRLQQRQQADTKAGVSPLMQGPLRVAAEDVPEQPETVAGTVGGYLPVAAEMTMGGGAVAKGAAAVIPNAARAGRKFQSVMAAAGDMPVNVEGAGNVALRIRELAERGASMPKAVKNFLERTTDPDQAGLVYREARDFASNLSRVSAKEYGRLSPVVAREVAAMSAELNKAIAATAKQAGKLDEYQSAMREYAKAMKIRGVVNSVAKGAKQAVPLATAAGAGWWLSSKLKSVIGGEP